MNGDVVFDVMKGAISYHDHYGWERGGGVEEVCRTDYHAIDLAKSAKEYGFRGRYSGLWKCFKVQARI